MGRLLETEERMKSIGCVIEIGMKRPEKTEISLNIGANVGIEELAVGTIADGIST